jgi:D-alanyl-D-alanine carboxypeptidase
VVAFRRFRATRVNHSIQNTLEETVSAVMAAGAPGGLAFARGPWGTRCGSAGIDASGRPFHATTPVEVGSVTKTFVAALVLALAYDGMLRLDDSLARHLPGLLSDDVAITVRSLLNHTSGLPDHFEDPGLRAAWLEDPAREWQAHELVDVVERLERHQRGVFRYSNFNYVLVGLVIESVTGRTVAEALRTAILDPLSLDATRLAETAASASGGLVSTAGDVARFLAALMDGEALDEASRAEMLTVVPSDWAESQGYGLGVERIESLVGADSPCGPAWGHLGFGRTTTTVALTTGDGSRQLVVAASARETSDAAWTAIGQGVWAVLCPPT